MMSDGTFGYLVTLYTMFRVPSHFVYYISEHIHTHSLGRSVKLASLVDV